MKKAFLLASILFISVISTACINNFAVQELNNKAKMFMDKGDYSSAIERLKSSVDLDANVFETHYNLAVAYTQAEDYENAIKSFNNAIELNSEFPDVYYSLAVSEESLAKSIITNEVHVNDDGSFEKAQVQKDAEAPIDKTLSDKAKSVIADLLDEAVDNYEKYLEKAPSADDKTDVEKNIEALKALEKEYDK